MKRRMKANPHEKGYHSREHDEDPTCHAINERDKQACEPVDPPTIDVLDAATGHAPGRKGGYEERK